MQQRGKWPSGLLASAAILGLVTIGPNAKAFSAHVDKHVNVTNLVADTTDGSTERVQERIADLHAKLHITVEQEPQFKAMANVMSVNGNALQTLLQQRAEDKDVSAAASMRWYERLVDAHAEALRKFVPVFEQLYAVFSKDQKKTADEMFARFGGKPRPGYRHHRRHLAE